MSIFRTLNEGRPILTDGAWGTELQKRGLPAGVSSDRWNLSHPADVEAVARDYVKAGSRVILTNTFRANAVALGGEFSIDELREINRRGAELSRAAAGTHVQVFASMGPTGRKLKSGEIDAAGVSAAFRDQAEALAAGGADALLLETFTDLEEARLAVRAIKPIGLPIVVSFYFDTSGRNKEKKATGAVPEDVGAAMAEEGADAVGANCGSGPEGFVVICRKLKLSSGLPVWIKPSAGLPAIEAGRAVYPMTPAAFAHALLEIANAGATFLGGCCGTTPAFIEALGHALQAGGG